MEVDGEGSFVALMALAGEEAEAARDVVGSSARGKADRGKMGMERAGFLVPAADQWWEVGMNVMKELYLDLIRGKVMMLMCGRMSLEQRMADQVLEAELDLPRVFLAISKHDRHSVVLKLLENSLLRPGHPLESRVAREELLDCFRIGCSNSLPLSAKSFGMD